MNEFTVETQDLLAFLARTPARPDQGRQAWRDTLAVKLGGDVAVIPDRLALRAGAFYETAVADAAHANVDFAGGPMFGGGVGGSVAFGRWEIALAYQLRHQATVSVSRGERPRLPAGAGQRLHAALHARPPATSTTSGSRRPP